MVSGPAYLVPLPASMRPDAKLAFVPGYTEEEMEQARSDAFEAGREAARAAMLPVQARLEGELDRIAKNMQAALGALAEERLELVHGAADSVIRFAFEIAARIVRVELVSRPEAIVPLVREALERAASAERIVVRLSPRDHAFLREHETKLPEAAGLPGLRLRADSSLSPGGLVVETEEGNLDARLETQLERIAEALRAPETSEREAAA